MFDRFCFGAKRSRDGVDEAASSPPAAASAAKRHDAKEAAPKRPKQSKSAGEPDQARSVAVAQPQTVAVKWQERWHAICDDCFERRRACEHHPERRLRLLIVGHNPSDHAWQSGYSYSNPSNRMWSLLNGTLSPLSWRGIVPADAEIVLQNRLPALIGVGFTSIGLEPGNDAAKYGKEIMSKWRDDFFRRLRRHAQRVCAAEHAADASGGSSDEDSRENCARPHAPMLVAFSGKRQFSWLFTPPLTKVDRYGKQTRLPSLWPRELAADSEVWVLPSSSGRAAMTTEQRALPYEQLAERLHELPWSPLDP